MNEQGRSARLSGFSFIEHASPENARARACADLRSEGGAFDAVLMLDPDQAIAVGSSDPGPDGARSWVDAAVEQYLGGAPLRLLYAATRIDHRDRLWNFDPGGGWAGSGCIFIPDVAYQAIKAAHPEPWSGGGVDRRGEDVVFTSRAVALGVELERLRNVTVWHCPRWRNGLVGYTDHEGEPRSVDRG